MAHDGRIGRQHVYRRVRALVRHKPRRKTAFGHTNDCCCVYAVSQVTGTASNGRSVCFVLLTHEETLLTHELRCFHVLDDARHGLDAFQRIASGRSFARKHDGICAVNDGISDVTHLCARRARVLNHGVQHLGGHDNWLCCFQALAHNNLLNNRYLGRGQFYTQVTAGNHDRISLGQNLIKPFHCRWNLYLCHHLRHGKALWQELLHELLQIHHIFRSAHKRECNIVHVLLQRKL